MPYTDEGRRVRYKILVNDMSYYHIRDAADLAYLHTQLMRQYMRCHEGCWDTYSDILKALDAAKDSFKEDVYTPYERRKKEENGGVF